MVVRPDPDRIKLVGTAISRLSLRAILELEERFDPQYSALQSLSDAVGRGPATAYAALVALVSYRMTMRGEEWWSCTSSMLSSMPRPNSVDELVSNVLRFLDNCPGSIIGREQKKLRVMRAAQGARGLLERLMAEPQIVIRSPEEILRGLSEGLRSPEYRKTITFAVKMAYYAARPRGSYEPLRFQIPMPVDVRVACITISSGLVSGARSYTELVREPRPAQEAWASISELSGVPVPHLDSMAWLSGWAPRDIGTVEEARKAVAQMLRNVVSADVAELVASEMVRKLCR